MEMEESGIALDSWDRERWRIEDLKNQRPYK